MGIGTDTAFGTGPMIIANQSFTATFRADFGARTIANPFNWETGTVANSVGFTGTNDMTFTSPTVDLAGATRTFNVLSTGTTTFTGNMINGSATSALVKAGGGTLVLSGASTYTGATTLNAGVLGFGSSSVGTTSGPIGVGAFNLNGGTLRAVGGARTVNNNITVGGNFAVDGSNDLTLGGTVALGAATRTVVVSNTGTTTFAGNVSSLTSGVGLTKDGNGLLVLAGTTNSIVGFTTVNRGELRVNGTIDSSGTGVFVNSGATLSGNGTIGQNVTVNGGAILKPGSSPGILNVGGTVTMSAGAIHSFQYAGPVTSQAYDSGLSATPGAGAGANNHLTITGNYTVDPNAIFKVNGNMADYTLNQPYSFRVASVTGTINGGAGFNITNPAQFDFSNFAGFAGATNLQWHNVGSVAYFNFTPVPEPLHILLVAGVGAAGFRWVRKRRQGAKA
jgi:autotransporter-associated beta strand protein